jgi:hypothetical protein
VNTTEETTQKFHGCGFSLSPKLATASCACHKTHETD